MASRTQPLCRKTGRGMIRYIQDIDTRTFLSVLHSRHHDSLAKAALIVSSSADGWLYFLLVPLAILLEPEQARSLILLALLAFALERSLYYLLKLSFRRRRPPQALQGIKSVIEAADQFSLPSGHTS